MIQRSLGLPPSTVAPLVQTTFDPCLTVIETLEIFDSDSFTPARVPPRRWVLSSEITGGVVRSALKRSAVVQ